MKPTRKAGLFRLRPGRAGRLSCLLVLCAGTIPLVLWVAAIRSAPPYSPYGPVDPPLRGDALKRQKVLKAIPTNHNVLVNVRLEHLPSTPDLTLLGKAGLRALERGLTHNINASVRYRIAVVLRDIADHHSMKALLAAMKDWNARVRLQAIWGLAAVGSPAARPRLVKILDNPEEQDYVKAAAIRALGWIGARGVESRLLRILKDPKSNYAMRRASIAAFWDLRLVTSASRLRQALILGLAAEDSAMRAFAALAAAELRDRNRALRAALTKRIRDRNAHVRNLAIYALGEIGDSASIPAIRSRLPAAQSGLFLNRIAFALHKMRDRQLIPLLGRLLKHQQAVIRLNAAFVLGDTGDKRAVPLLLAALKDGNDVVRASATAALGKLKDRRAVGQLKRLTTSKNVSLRIEALLALNKITNGAYNNQFARELLRHKQHNIRILAARELARRGDPRAIVPLTQCLDWGYCNPYQVSLGLENISSARAIAPLLTAYVRRVGRYGAAVLLRTLGKKKLTERHRAVLRTVLPLAWRIGHTRRGIIRLLGRLRDAAARPAYWSVLKSRDRLVVLNGAYALANQGYARGRRVLITELTQAAPRTKRGVADLIRSLTHPVSRAAIRPQVRSAMRGHGPLTKIAAAYALTAWDPAAGIKILTSMLGSTSRRQRAEAARYLVRRELRNQRHYIKKALDAERRTPVKGMLRRILRIVTPASFKPKLGRTLPY
jgi:HEAT repeat protein